jgi:hypothetical protein
VTPVNETGVLGNVADGVQSAARLVRISNFPPGNVPFVLAVTMLASRDQVK